MTETEGGATVVRSASFEYDVRGHITKTVKVLDSSTFTTQQTYDSANRVETVTYPDGEVVTNTFDPAGNLDTVSGLKGGVTTTYVTDIQYDAFGQRTQMALGNGTTTLYAYDDASFRLNQLATVGPGGVVLQNLGYAYDAVGNVRMIADGVNAAYNESFGYDDLHRLTSATGIYGALRYAYDPIGNLICNSQLTASPAALCDPSSSAFAPNYAYPPSGASSVRPHAVNQAGPYTYTYDANGNMTGGAGRTLAYDVDNRPTSITTSNGTATFAYDYTGERVKKQANGTLTYYVGGIYEDAGTNNYVKYLFAGSTRVAQKTQAGAVLYYHGNHLGSTHVVTDGNGVKQGELHYYPYGQTYSDTSGVTHKYTGQEFDTETTLYYYHARYYDPVLGRFVSGDTVGIQFTNPQSLNRYSYALNNPLKYIDPTGHDIDEAGNIVQIVDGKLIVVGGAETSNAGQVYTAQWSPDTGQVQNGWVNRVEAVDPWLDALRAEGQQRGGGNSLSIFYKGGSGTSGSGNVIERMALELNKQGRPAVALEATQAQVGGQLANTASNRFGWENFNLAGHSLGGGAAVETAWANPSINFRNLFTVDSVCDWNCGMIPRNVGTNYNPYQTGFLGGTVNSLAPENDTTLINNWNLSNVTHFSIVDPQQSFVPRFIINTIIAGP